MLGIVSVEEPYKKTEIPQCQNCQQYGHTKGYCNYGPKCVKCGLPPAPWKAPDTRSQDPALSFPSLPANTASLQHFEHPSHPQATQPVLQQEKLPPKQQQEQLSIQPQWRPQRPYKILTRILSCFPNRNRAQGCHINSNSNISKPSLIQSNANNQFNNFNQAFSMPNNTKRDLRNNCLNYASSSINHNHIPKPYPLCPTELLHKSPLIYQNPIIIPHPPTNRIKDLT
ncbi:hypothetical protein AAG570_011703 [Ranatra chinensis]|uniref:Uncharacterized protein n=1 Tax=Ranatra chinensis TaxID=642074 RepID=A0ABD0YGN4_9HEMI